MTSQQITELRGASADHPSEHNALWEIAFQLAVMNEAGNACIPPEVDRTQPVLNGAAYRELYNAALNEWRNRHSYRDAADAAADWNRLKLAIERCTFRGGDPVDAAERKEICKMCRFCVRHCECLRVASEGTYSGVCGACVAGRTVTGRVPFNDRVGVFNPFLRELYRAAAELVANPPVAGLPVLDRLGNAVRAFEAEPFA